jgi:hypothetical protein
VTRRGRRGDETDEADEGEGTGDPTANAGPSLASMTNKTESERMRTRGKRCERPIGKGISEGQVRHFACPAGHMSAIKGNG